MASKKSKLDWLIKATWYLVQVAEKEENKTGDPTPPPGPPPK